MIKKLTLFAATATAVAALTAAPAAATHAHHLETPGTCVDRNGAGFGTGQQHHGHSFHDRVHMGTPGQHAFTQERNPVAVHGGGICD